MDMFWFGAFCMFMIAILAWQLGSLKDRVGAIEKVMGEDKNVRTALDNAHDTDYLE
jgi:hypothetical protein